MYKQYFRRDEFGNTTGFPIHLLGGTYFVGGLWPCFLGEVVAQQVQCAFVCLALLD